VTPDVARIREQRAPFEALEAEIVRLSLASPGDLHDTAVDALRYVVRFAKLGLVRARSGEDVDLGEFLTQHAWTVRHKLAPHLLDDHSLWGAMRELPGLVAQTRERRRQVLVHLPLDEESLEAEVTTRPLVVACGGGGGAGYGYAGAWTLFHRRGLQPELVAGTSIGALLAMFRARRRVFDGAALMAASERLSFEKVFRVLDMDSRYGLPATLRLYLRASIGSLFHSPEGRPLTFRDLEVPLLVVTTGIGVEALKHDLSWYEHALDQAVAPGFRARTSHVAQVAVMANIFREFLANEELLHEVVFGADPETMEADIVDAAGFSSSIPGLIHYDVLRDDQRMKSLLDTLYARYGITRLVEGGMVNNLPVRPAYQEVMAGRIGRRDAYIVALDCFSPRLSKPLYFPIQQLVRPNVQRNLTYANLYFPLDRTLSPLNLVPGASDLTRAMDWTMNELTPHMPTIERMCAPLRPLH